MKNALVVFTALFVGSAMVGCSSKSSPGGGGAPANPNPPARAHDSGGNSGPAWSLKFQSKCQNISDEECLGAYGFTVFSDGKFQIGPSPQGSVKNGSLTPEELTALSAALNPVLAESSFGAEVHEAMAGEENANDDSITLIRGSSAGETIVHAAATDFSHRTQSGEVAKALLGAMKALTAKYYSAPLADPCNDAASSLQKLYASMQTCSTNADCAYVDEYLQEVDPNSHSYLTTDDCSLVKPLTVANLKLLNEGRDKLMEATSRFQTSCSTRPQRNDCTQTAGFNIMNPATCKQGVCQAGPSSLTTH